MTAVPPPRQGPTAGEPTPKFHQELGLFDATMLVTGTMIGSGIFIVSAGMARELGSSGWLMAAWVLTGAITLLGALSYAELAAMMPQAGGQYVYLREAFGGLWGFLYGWAVFWIIQTGTIAAVAVAFAKFLGVWIKQLGTDVVLFESGNLNLSLTLPGMEKPIFQRDKLAISAGQLVAVAVVLLLSALNARGVQTGKRVQNVFTLAKTAALILLIVVGLYFAANTHAIQENTTDVWSGAAATPAVQSIHAMMGGPLLLAVLMVLGGAMVGSLFSADAWNNITFTAGEVKNPQRVLPLSLVLGVGLVILLYLLANVAYLAALPLEGDPTGSTALERGVSHALDDRVGTAVFDLVSPQWGAKIMALAIMISTFGCVNGLVLMGARLYYAMARDGLFFQAVGKLNTRGVPAIGLGLQGAWATVLVFTGTYGELLDYVIFAALLFYVLTVVGLFVLRRRRPEMPRPYRVIGYPLVPGLYVALCAAIMIDLLVVKPEFTWPGLLLVLCGIPVYFAWQRFKQPVAHES